METIEYFGVADKTDWGDGPWQGEPDKRQWQDKTTGLPCLMVRGPSGSWCGYVGVPPGHAAHGLHYDGEPADAAEARRAENRRLLHLNVGKPIEEWERPFATARVVSPAGEKVAALCVHGGLTFADQCADQSRDAWESFRLREAAMLSEAERFPKGDSARTLKRWAGCFDDYDLWRDRMQASAICHLPALGEPDGVWWFGFDSAHAGDLMPAHRAVMREIGISEPSEATRAAMAGYEWRDVYRDVAYVQAECARLAEQLAAITVPLIEHHEEDD